MIKNTLTTSDIMDLISEYKAEIRKLSAKISFCENRILELEELIDDENIFSNTDSFNNISGRISARPRRIETRARKPYPLSDWDTLILNVIREEGRAILSKELYNRCFIKAAEMGIAMDETKNKAKINQCLVKLSDRRHDIEKVRYGGRGYAYCLPEWVDEDGRIKDEYTSRDTAIINDRDATM